MNPEKKTLAVSPPNHERLYMIKFKEKVGTMNEVIGILLDRYEEASHE